MSLLLLPKCVKRRLVRDVVFDAVCDVVVAVVIGVAVDILAVGIRLRLRLRLHLVMAVMIAVTGGRVRDKSRSEAPQFKLKLDRLASRIRLIREPHPPGLGDHSLLRRTE